MERKSMFGMKAWAPALVLAAVLVVVVASVGFGQGATSRVSFANDVVPMFVASCTSCHGGESPSASLNLETNAYDNLVGVYSTRVEPQMMFVKAGDPANSYLVHKLQGTHEAVGGRGQRMPRSAEPWTDEQMELIIRWISEGALNN